MSRSPRFTLDLPDSPPPEVLDEIDAAWERAQVLVELGLHFEIDAERPHRAFGEMRNPDGTARRFSATHAILLACGDAAEPTERLLAV